MVCIKCGQDMEQTCDSGFNYVKSIDKHTYFCFKCSVLGYSYSYPKNKEEIEKQFDLSSLEI